MPDPSVLVRQLQGGPVIYVGISPGAPAFQNSWVNFDGNDPTQHRCAYFYRDARRVYLGGVIKSGANATTAFVLPPGYRPLPAGVNTNVGIPVAANANGAELSINPANGAVQPTNLGTSNVTVFVFLDGASFLAA